MLVMDQAGWHKSGELNVPDNISVLFYLHILLMLASTRAGLGDIKDIGLISQDTGVYESELLESYQSHLRSLESLLSICMTGLQKHAQRDDGLNTINVIFGNWYNSSVFGIL